MPIKLLSPQLANQIAAGEVVERPASVVKELLENSLDAGADRIEIDIEKGGHKRIRIRDNGSGIAKDELTLALSRHATSKIITLDDLEQIMSLGFRGEALASISSVSRLTLTSRPANQEQAWEAFCEGRDMAVSVQPAAHPVGTTIDVVDLFYNTPARRKFLRTEKTEFHHIEDVVKRIALSNPNVGFVLKHNGKPIRRHMPDSQHSLAHRISSVVGQKFIKNAIHTQVTYEGIHLEAWLGDEGLLRSSSDCQFSFINGRGMRDKLILHAVRQAYESVWGVLEQPSFVMYLTIDPKEVDVNVHPAKHEVRFQQGRLVHDFICKAVCDALYSVTSEECVSVQDPASNESSEFTFANNEPTHDYIRPLTHSSGSSVSESKATGGSSFQSGRNSSSKVGAEYNRNFQSLMSPTDTLATDSANETSLPYLPLGDSARLYSQENSVFLLSAHSLLPEWLFLLCDKASHSQPLLMPVAITFEPLSEHVLAALKQLSFEISYTAGKYRLQQVPAGTRHLPWLRWFEPMLINSLEAEAPTKKIFEFSNALAPESTMLIWKWLEQFSPSVQWEYIQRFGKVRDLKSVTALWDTKNGD